VDSGYRNLSRWFQGRTPEELGFPELYFGSVCRLVHVYRGRFCFDFGLAAACTPSTISIKSGTEYNLSLEVSGVSAGITHTQETEVSFTITECDSVRPVLCFEDSMLFTYDCEHWLGPFHWTSQQTLFRPAGRPTLWGNFIKNDPRCGCQKRTSLAPSDARTQVASAPFYSTKVLTPGTFTSIPSGPTEGDPGELATAAVEAFIAAGEGRSGVVGTDGRVHWLSDTSTKPLQPPIHILSAGIRGTYRVDRHHPKLPVFAVTGCSPALRAVVRVTAGQPSAEIAEQRATVRHGRATTLWAEIDLSKLPAGSAGIATIEIDTLEGGCGRVMATLPFFVT